MPTLYFDGQAGVAGDMILGVLIDLGLSVEELTETLTPIAPVAFSIRVERVSVFGLHAQRVSVEVGEEKAHRHLKDVLALLDRGSLSDAVRERAARTYRRLADAEATIHNSTPETVHFHEVGATDAIVDIAGTVWGLERLGIERVLSAPIVMGSGVGRSAHGPIIYPAPAALEIVRGLPVRFEEGIGETTTPTGAAILAEVAEFTDELLMTPERVGYGAGHKQFDDRPNLLRGTLGEVSEAFDIDHIWVGTSDIDNTRPEVFDWLAERLRAAGAIDVVFSDVAMKKGRRGTRIEVLCTAAQRPQMAELILSETGSLGIRWNPVVRTKLPRRCETIDTPWGAIRIKVAVAPNGERGIPEYDDCRAAAEQHRVPLQTIIDTATRMYHDREN
ncbi:MAG: nickel pincer cofactor biosynthesis protein LarC [Candidatus Zixiibacteriota bacterium]